MKKNNLRVWSGVTLLAGALCLISEPVKAGPIVLINDDFNSVTTLTYNSVNYQTQEDLSGTVDSYFTTVGGTNVDVLGNISPVLDESPAYDLAPFGGICAAADATADCLDLNGTGTGAQATLRSTVDITTAGTVVLTSDLLGTSGYLSDAAGSGTSRNTSTSTTIVFGNSTCIASPSAENCVYYNDVTLSNPTCYTGGTPSTACVYDEVSSALTVGTGTYYVEYISNQSGDMGSLLTDVNLVETADAPSVPEPGTLVLLGSALLGLGGVRRFRARR